MLAEDTLGMAEIVEGAGVHQEQLRLILPDHIAGNAQNELIHPGPLHHINSAALFVARNELILVGLDQFQHLLGGRKRRRGRAERLKNGY